MFILQRAIGETIKIGDDIEIKIVPGKGRGMVGVGISAPRDLRIQRGEIVQQVEALMNDAGAHKWTDDELKQLSDARAILQRKHPNVNSN